MSRTERGKCAVVASLLLLSLTAGCGRKETNYSFSFDIVKKDDYIVVVFNGKHAPRIDDLQNTLDEIGWPSVNNATLPILTAKGNLRVGEHNHGRCWQNYENGPLRVVGKLDTDANHDYYDAIWKIFLYEKGTPAFCGDQKLAELVPEYPYAD